LGAFNASKISNSIHSSNLVATQFQHTIKCLRSDNGAEFQMVDFFAKQGTIHKLSCVETPQQNSVVERKHQHILNVTRSLRLQAHLPFEFWGDCVLTAIHLINRIPTPNLSNKTPHEILFSKPPLYSHLKVFGCLAYASSLCQARNKFDSRAIPCVFIGYPYAIKGYKLYDLHTKFVFISRNVIFHEHIFPFAINLLHPNSDGCFSFSSPSFSSPSFPSSSFPTTSTETFFVHPVISPIDSANFPFNTSSFSSPNPVPPISVPPNSTSAESPSNVISSSPSPTLPTPNPYVIRHSTRIRRPPEYLQQYHCHLASTLPGFVSKDSFFGESGNSFPLSSFVSYDQLSPPFKRFCLSISSNVEPQFYHEAVKHAH
jgi:hypothetical protein